MFTSLGEYEKINFEVNVYFINSTVKKIYVDLDIFAKLTFCVLDTSDSEFIHESVECFYDYSKSYTLVSYKLVSDRIYFPNIIRVLRIFF